LRIATPTEKSLGTFEEEKSDVTALRSGAKTLSDKRFHRQNRRYRRTKLGDTGRLNLKTGVVPLNGANIGQKTFFKKLLKRSCQISPEE